jgi:hypothetical protein
MCTDSGSGDKIAEQLRTAADAQRIADAASAQACVERLTAALRSRGLVVTAKSPTVSVRNASVAGEGAQGKTMSPGLGQHVLICDYGDFGLTWCWVWPGLRPAERDVPTPPPEIEPMCPAAEIERAADLITNVVRLRDSEVAG